MSSTYLQRHDKPKFVTCMVFAENGDLITGDSNGNLFIWGKGKSSQHVYLFRYTPGETDFVGVLHSEQYTENNAGTV